MARNRAALERAASSPAHAPRAGDMEYKMYILYGGDFTRAPLAQWVLEEGEIEYELRKIDILKGKHRSGEFLAINSGVSLGLVEGKSTVITSLSKRHGNLFADLRGSGLETFPEAVPFLGCKH